MQLTPKEIVRELDRFIVGQSEAKRAVAIALRYVPDIQGSYQQIKNAQEARGIEMSAKAKLLTRIRRVGAIIFPLLFSSMERIDVVSNAMELRGFGKHPKRTWYAEKPLRRNDFLVIAATVLFAAAAMTAAAAASSDETVFSGSETFAVSFSPFGASGSS